MRVRINRLWAKERIMRGTSSFMLKLMVIASVAITGVAQTQSDPYHVVQKWMKMPAGFIMGTPKGVTPPPQRDKTGERVPGTLAAFAGVAVDDQDHVYAFHRGQERLTDAAPPDLNSRDHPVVVFDSDGKFIRWAGDGIPGGLNFPHMLDIDADNMLWIADRNNHRVLKLNKDLNTVALQLGTTGEKGMDATHFNLPADVAWTKNGDIFVVDGYGNNRVAKFSKDGKFIKSWGSGPEAPGTADGQFHLPHSIVVDYTDRLYVLDRENHRVQIFDANGNFLGKWTDVGNPWGITIKRDGGRDGFAYLTDHATEQIFKVTMKDGKIVAKWGSRGQGPGQFDWAHDIAVDSKGAVYVSDTYGQRIQKFVDGKLVSMLGRGDRGWVTPGS
jgi:peptidylamidoglycolate lyase